MAGEKPFPLYTDGTSVFYTTDGVNFNQLGGGGATVQTAAPVSGDGSTGSKVTIAAGAIALTKLATQADQTALINVSGGAASPVAGTATQLTALINAASASLSGAMTATQFSKLLGLDALARGADLTDASATIQPFSDKCSLYVLPNGVLTADRTLTVSITSGTPVAQTIVDILVLDTSAHSFTIQNNTPTTLYTHAGSGVPMIYRLFSSGGGVFGTNTVFFANANQ